MLILILVSCFCMHAIAWEVPGYPNASAPAPYIRVGDQVVLKCWSFGGDPTPDIWFTVDGTNATSIKGTGQTFSWAIEGTTKTQRTYTFVADRTDNKRVFDCNVYNGYNLLQGPLKRSVYIMMEIPPFYPTFDGPVEVIDGTAYNWTCRSNGAVPKQDVEIYFPSKNPILDFRETWEKSPADGTFIVTGTLFYTPTQADNNQQLCCDVKHQAINTGDQRICKTLKVRALPDPPTISGKSTIAVGKMETWYVVSSGGNPASSLHMTLNGNMINNGFTSSSSQIPGSIEYRTTGSLQWTPSMFDVGKQTLCVVATHPDLTSPQTACMDVNVQVPPQHPMLSGPSSIAVGTTDTWTSVSVGGNPASILKMTIDGTYVTNGFTTQVSVLPGGETYTTSGTFNWTPTNFHIGLRELCVEAHHLLLTSFQKSCKNVSVEVPPQPPTLVGPTTITAGKQGSWSGASLGGYPAASLRMTLNGNYILNGFTSQTSPEFGKNTFKTEGQLNWTPSMADVGTQRLCIEATHIRLTMPHISCLNVVVHEPAPTTLNFIGPSMITSGDSSTWTCTSDIPAPTLEMTLDGIRVQFQQNSNQIIYNKAFDVTNAGSQLCCKASHHLMPQGLSECKTLNIQAAPNPPTISGPSIIAVGVQGRWTVISSGGNPASVLQVTLNGTPINYGFTSSSSQMPGNVFMTTGSLDWTPIMSDVGTQTLCGKVTHQALSVPQLACMDVEVQVIPQPPTLTGPLSITVGTPGTWTSVSAGGNPASTLKMTIDGVYVTNGFSTQVTPIGNTFSTSGTLNWTPTNSDVGLREFCVEAYHDLLNPYQKICKQVRVEDPAPSTLFFDGPSVLTNGVSETWTCTSDKAADTLEITFNGVRLNFNQNSNQITYSGSFGVNQMGKQLCCKASHQSMPQGLSRCKTLDIRVTPQSPGLSGPSTIAVGTMNTWTCESIGGFPAATLSVKLNGNYETNGFTQSSQLTGSNTFTTTGMFVWTPTQFNTGSNELCCEATHPTLPVSSPQRICKDIVVQVPPSTIDLVGPPSIQNGDSATWTCTSIGGIPRPTLMKITLGGVQVMSSQDTTSVVYTGTFDNFDNGKQICCVVYHPLYPSQGVEQCSLLQIEQIQVDSITLTGPTQLSSGHQGTWTCTYTGGTPTLQMTINNNPVYGSVNKALGFDQTVLSLQWAPTLTNNNQYLCCSAIGVTNPPPQCLRLQIQASSTTCQGPGDIAFALDGSDSISKNNFQIMKNFTLQNIEIFGLGVDKIMVGGLVFSDDVTDQFLPSASEFLIRNKISNFIQPRSATRTDLAVKELRESILVGSRSKVAVIITDGESFDKTKTKQEVALAKTAGIVFVTVGIDMKPGSGGQTELAQIASFPEANLMITDFNSLKEITEISKLRDILCQVITTTTSTMTPLQTTTTPNLVTQPLVSNPLCEGCAIDDGHGYNPNLSDCSKFYQCYLTTNSGGTQIMKAQDTQCAFGTFWSQKDLTCVPWVLTTCPTAGNICNGQPDMTKFAYLGCDTYWNCMNNIPVASRCQSGHVFNAITLTCVSDPTNACFNTVTQPCNSLPDANDAAKYFEKVTQPDGSVVNVHMQCPPGTEYDNTRCLCANLNNNAVVVPSDCTPLIEHGVGNQFTWKQTENLMVGHSGVTFESAPSKIVFSPKSHINMWKSAHHEYKDSFAATMTIEKSAFSGGTPVVEQILLNCIYSTSPTGAMTEIPSIQLQVMQMTGSNTFIGQIVTETGAEIVTVTQTTSLTAPTDIIFAYDGSKLVLKVGSDEVSKPLTGDIKVTQSGIVMGRGMEPDQMALDAKIAMLKIYDCISTDVAGKLTNI